MRGIPHEIGPNLSAYASLTTSRGLKGIGDIGLRYNFSTQFATIQAIPSQPNRFQTEAQDVGRRQLLLVVLCKNHWFHMRQSFLVRHRIPLAETDAISPRPAIDHRFRVRCDECGKEYLYKPSEVLRSGQEPPESFTPHPLFRDEDAETHSNVTDPATKAASAGGKAG
jgi:hypothetical protein